jgi:hypothetical protein
MEASHLSRTIQSERAGSMNKGTTVGIDGKARGRVLSEQHTLRGNGMLTDANDLLD